ERMSIAISRDLADGEVVLTGAASAIPLAACLLAQARHAPSLTILGAGVYVMFYGGMQIDRYGSVNLHYIPTANGVLRGPGLANSALGHTAARTILYTERHDRRTLVEAVGYASVIGQAWRGRSRAELGLPNAGPSALFTPDVLFRPDSRGIFVPARAMGSGGWDDVIARTGWPMPPEPPQAFEVVQDEVRTLRQFVDPGGLLACPVHPAVAHAGKQS